MKLWKRQLGLTAAAMFLLAAALWSTGQSADKKEEDPAVARTRKTALMLDDLYKNAIVIVTTHYVDEKSDLAAGDAFQALFKAMKDKGWHEVRLLDATGQPYDDDNAPRKGFEQKAVDALMGGEKTYEAVVEKEGKRYLQFATPIPVVMDKCVMCHAHYSEVPKGGVIGALSYTVPVE